MIRLRAATFADAELLFGWVNSPSSLLGKICTETSIEWPKHCLWLKKRLEEPGTSIWIAYEEDNAVGQVRFEQKDANDSSILDVDIFVVESARGKGLAKALLTDASKKLAKQHPGARLRARVLAQNKASQMLFESLGYNLMAKEYDYFIYVGEL